MSSPICHVEIPVRNMARAKKFYRSVFGWSFKAFSPRYVMYMTGAGERLGGALAKTDLKELPPDGGVVVYLKVESVSAALRRAKAFGVKTLLKCAEIGGENGFIAQIRDTEGNRVGLWSASR